MRIGYLLQQGVEIRKPPFDGPATHVREVLSELARRGHAVRVLMRLEGKLWTSTGLAGFRPIVVRHADRGPLRLVEKAIRRAQFELGLPYANVFESLRFALACRQELVDTEVLLERQSWMGYGGGLASAWLGVPLVVEYNGDHLHDLAAKGTAPEGLQRRLSLALMGWANRRAAHVVATGGGWRDHFVRTWGCDASKVTVIENGTALVKLLKRGQLRAFGEIDSQDGELRLVYVGGFYAWHGVDVLIRAAARAQAQGVTLRLLMIGSGAGLGEAQRLAADCGLEQRVEFAGHLTPETFAPRLADADIGLSPYCGWKEFSGLKLFDYKAAGLAIIASGQNGQPATLRHGSTGWIVPPCDETALSEAIVTLGRDGALRRRLGRKAREEAEACHGWDNTAQALEQVLSTVLRADHEVRYERA